MWTFYNILKFALQLWQKQKWHLKNERKLLVDRKPNRHACMHQLVICRLHFTSIYFHSTGSLGWHSGCCLLVIFPVSILLLGSLGWLSAPNGLRVLPGSLFLPLSLSVSLWLAPTLQPLLTLMPFYMLRNKIGTVDNRCWKTSAEWSTSNETGVNWYQRTWKHGFISCVCETQSARLVVYIFGRQTAKHN